MSNIYGQGIAFPPRLDGYGRLAWSVGEVNIRESIAVILKTNVRERLSLPTFGAGLGAFLFEPNNAGTHARIAHAIETALKQWEPRISLSEVSVSADPANVEAAIATIQYSLVATGASEQVSLSIPLGGRL
ncbi:GPW/gp25 family protein [Sphingorhabdus sp.]|jgi:phage baseplate assembly protein W|uniref:GPW/gp25 family protein n=1 Tax=Sphingorhabdus sp. TaxID=1902408 RepID=UPI001B591096|nr:GPW/gp25 family protein [Sphingomonadales bacterium]MBL0021592.1 GPW/gp25 family protein [Sphingomonadales bacterium]MBP6434621.1 GPW/gp25 family protein [Sphingorhabdus sp.]